MEYGREKCGNLLDENLTVVQPGERVSFAKRHQVHRIRRSR